jgi:hypothetical protein
LIRKGAGTQFDPEIVTVFLEIIAQAKARRKVKPSENVPKKNEGVYEQGQGTVEVDKEMPAMAPVMTQDHTRFQGEDVGNTHR